MIRRKRRISKDGQPVRCSICKEKTAHHTVHGYHPYGGSTCCDNCFTILKVAYQEEMVREDREETEGERQAWRNIL